MDQLKSYADERLMPGCLYCSETPETREHVPSRILLDEPYPDNLPVFAACARCNRGFSLDEEYVACLIECSRSGSVDSVQRPKISRVLDESPALAERLRQARTVSESGEVIFQAENQRVSNIVLKLARGHAAYELHEQKREDPSHVMFVPLHSLTPAARDHFEKPPVPAGWPEVGTRALQRVVISVVGPPSPPAPDWIEVQEGQYRYLVVAEDVTIVRFVIGEYLACEVVW